jgi:cytoskeletal protein CcmA (bactofilin family)
MFNKTKESAPAAPPPPPVAATPMKRAAGRSSAPSIISSDLVVQGTLSSSGDVQIDGRVEGDVHSAGLVIGEKAHIEGEVFAEDVTVRGHVQGSIRARKVLLCSTCHVEGNILHEAFAVEAGAFFEGNCRHSDNPLAEEDSHKPAGHDRRSANAQPTNGSGSTGGADPVQPRPAYTAASVAKAV